MPHDPKEIIAEAEAARKELGTGGSAIGTADALEAADIALRLIINLTKIVSEQRQDQTE